MRSIPSVTFLTIISGIFIIPGIVCDKKPRWGQKSVVFDIDQIEFDGNLPADAIYKPERNRILGIRVYKGIVYVTIPRYGQRTGIPATLATVKKGDDGKVLFSPFPDWDFQAMGTPCTTLQDARSLEVDPKTDLLYIADNGDGQHCGAKLVIYDLAKKAVNATHALVTNGNTTLGDITVDNQGVVYIANSNNYGSLWIVDTKNGERYDVLDHSFGGKNSEKFVFENDTYSSKSAIKTIALTPDSNFLFYSSNNQHLWQFKSNMKEQLQLRRGIINNARSPGLKNFHGFSILMSKQFLYFSNVDNKSISYWDRNSDLKKQNQDPNSVVKENEAMIDIQPKLEYFPGKMALDEDGYLWVVTMDLGMYFDETDSTDTRMKIVKIFVNNQPYNSPEMNVSSSGQILMSAVIVFICCLMASI